MIRTLRGTIHPGKIGNVIIETSSGIGFEVGVPANSSLFKNLEGTEVKVFTSMIVREDAMNLYGFSDKESLELFELLITVNGIGAKAAMAIMSVLPPDQLKRAVGMGDVAAISTANGVGKKTAERVILELKDKIGHFEEGMVETSDISSAITDEKNEAVAALVSLGYSKDEASKAVNSISEENLTTSEYIKKALNSFRL